MIACAIFVIAGFIAWQNTAPIDSEREPTPDEILWAMFSIVCWVMAILCAVGVVSE